MGMGMGMGFGGYLLFTVDTREARGWKRSLKPWRCLRTSHESVPMNDELTAYQRSDSVEGRKVPFAVRTTAL